MSKLSFEVDDSLLEEVEVILDSVGVDIDIAFSIFMKKIVKEQGLPFTLKQTKQSNSFEVNQENDEHSKKQTKQSNSFEVNQENDEHSKRRKNNSITTEMIEEVWNAFLEYRKGFGEVGELADKVSEKTGMNRGSAMIYINVLIKLAEGEINKRSMKPSDFEFFLMKFKNTLSKEEFKNAVRSVEVSIPYWNNNIPTFADSMKDLIAKIK
jgi:addiction module RelB/DinJ family antitoxin